MQVPAEARGESEFSGCRGQFDFVMVVQVTAGSRLAVGLRDQVNIKVRGRCLSCECRYLKRSEGVGGHVSLGSCRSPMVQ